jgi:hypothetical protein
LPYKWSVKGLCNIPAPGGVVGPCIECEHVSCIEVRELVKLPCGICGRPIGYGNLYRYRFPSDRVHFICEENGGEQQYS